MNDRGGFFKPIYLTNALIGREVLINPLSSRQRNKSLSACKQKREVKGGLWSEWEGKTLGRGELKWLVKESNYGQATLCESKMGIRALRIFVQLLREPHHRPSSRWLTDPFPRKTLLSTNRRIEHEASSRSNASSDVCFDATRCLSSAISELLCGWYG